nr:reverse transcriptase domain-containing protein [Tanacetum cinerariifolium]
VIKKEVIKLFDSGLIYPIFDSPWVSLVHYVPKKGGTTVIKNKDNELVPTRCMMAIFYDMIEETMEVFIDDFSVFVDSFSLCLSHLDKMLQRGAENLAAEHLSRLENPHQDELGKNKITETFPLEMLGENHASWSDKLDDALWAFRTAFKTPIGCTPYKLVYGKACHLPIELEHKAYWALENCNFDKFQLNELNELRDQAYENSLIYKEKTKKIHDSKIKNRVFSIGDRVLLFNSHSKIFLGTLKTRWTGPFTITQVFPYGTVEFSQTDRRNFKGDDHRLKHYF